MTAGPGPRVAALLELLRPVAAELVVALDARADEETERAVAAIADVVIRYPYREPVDRPLPWLLSVCQGEWILNVDDDEIPSAELLAALPALVRAKDVTHYWLLRRWLWPDARSAIAEHPWTADYQLRLMRNDPLLLSFPSETHRPIQAVGPHRFLRLPLYHADLLLNPLERREAKARRYEKLRPGKRVGGGPMNHVFHLPERRPGLRVAPLPEHDAALVETVLRGAAVSAVPPPRPVARATEAEIDRMWAGRELDDADYRARIELLDTVDGLRECEQRTVDVLVTNLSATTWPAEHRAEPELRLSYQWVDAAGRLDYGLQTPLPADLDPGESAVVPLHVLAPARAGRYTLRVDVVHERVRWFHCDVDTEVEVARRLRVALVGDAAAVASTLDQLAEEAPEFEPVVLSSHTQTEPFGPDAAPDLREYLFHDTVPGRRRDWWSIVRRTLALDAAVRGRRAGREVRPLLHGGEAFLDAVAGSTHLLRVVGPCEPGRRERWLERVTLRTARRLGATVVVAKPGELGLR